jgi:hypothetical protein
VGAGLTDPARGSSSDAVALESSADGTLTIHPDPRRLPKRGSLAALPFAVVGLIRLLLLGWLGVVIIVTVVGLAAGAAFLIRRQRAFHSFARLTPSTLTVKPWYRRPRSVPREAVSRVVLATTNLGLGFGEPDLLFMLFLDADGRCLLSLSCLGIPPSDATAFANALGVPVHSLPDRLGPKELRREYPGSISAFYSHQVAFGVGIGLAIAALVIGGTVGWAALTGQFVPPKPVALGVTQSEHAPGGRFDNHVDDVTVLGVDNPAHASIPASASEPGTHFVGVAIRVKNTGSRLIPAPAMDVAARDSAGVLYWVDQMGDAAAAKLNTDADVGQGTTETAYVLIRVPDSAILTRVEFNSTSSDNARLSWIVPSQPPPPTPRPAPLGQAFSLGGQQVTTLAVDDPAHGYPATSNVPPGAHLVGVEVRITNTGSSDAAPPYQPLSVVDSGGGRRDEVDVSASVGAAQNPVKSGQTVTTTVFFDVPVGARVVEVDYEYYPAGLSAGAGRATVAWAVPTPSQG